MNQRELHVKLCTVCQEYILLFTKIMNKILMGICIFKNGTRLTVTITVVPKVSANLLLLIRETANAILIKIQKTLNRQGCITCFSIRFRTSFKLADFLAQLLLSPEVSVAWALGILSPSNMEGGSEMRVTSDPMVETGRRRMTRMFRFLRQ